MGDVTAILSAARRNEPGAADRLLRAVYDELRRLAAGKLAGERPGQTLQATALVHEAFLRLNPDGRGAGQWETRAHFFAAAAEAMRRILVEAARRKGRLKHGGEHRRLDFSDADAESARIAAPDCTDLLALDEALERLAAIDPLKAQLVKLRYFTGLTMEQAASILGISRATADRHWRFTRAWLFKEISHGGH